MSRNLLQNSSILRSVADRIKTMPYSIDNLLEDMKTYSFINELVENRMEYNK